MSYNNFQNRTVRHIHGKHMEATTHVLIVEQIARRKVATKGCVLDKKNFFFIIDHISRFYENLHGGLLHKVLVSRKSALVLQSTLRTKSNLDRIILMTVVPPKCKPYKPVDVLPRKHLHFKIVRGKYLALKDVMNSCLLGYHNFSGAHFDTTHGWEAKFIERMKPFLWGTNQNSIHFK